MVDGVPDQIGRYKVLNELGRGGFGRVYQAFDASMRRKVAVKILTEHGDDVLTRFRNEAFVAGNLRHENIVTVYEYGEYQSQPFLAMEYLEGEDLQHIIGSHRPLTLLDVCNIMSQVADGLNCAHQNGVVHRDVKPANIMVLPDGTVKIMDFGIARLTGDVDSTRLTQEGSLVGTLRYMAPEQFGGAQVDALCDIFAYGVIYYELLTGRHPFEPPGPSVLDHRALMFKISFSDPPPLRSLNPECPEALERLILRILSKDRDTRYQTLRDVQYDVEMVRNDLQRQRAAELLALCEQQFDSDQFETARSTVLEVLRLDPSNSTARDLRERAQQRLKQQALQPKIAALLAAGEDYVGQRKFADALKSFESALKLDPHEVAIQGRIEQVKSLVEHHRAAEAFLAEARRQFENHSLTSAHRSVSEALKHEPQSATAIELCRVIQAAIEIRQKQRRIEEVLHKAEGLLLVQSYDEAITLIMGLGSDVESPQVSRLLNILQGEKCHQERRDKLRTGLSSATDLLRDHRPGEAIGCLKTLMLDFPEEHEVKHLLFYAQKELEAEARIRAIKEITTQATSLAESREFDAALALIDRVLKQYPNESSLARLFGSTMAAKAAWERTEAVREALKECTQLRAQQRFAEAIELVESTLREFGGEEALIEALEQLQDDWEEERRLGAIRQAAEHAEQLIGESKFVPARQHLREALLQFPGQARLGELLERTEGELRSLERAGALEAIEREVSTLLSIQSFDKAITAIDRGLDSWTDATTLRLRRAEVSAAKSVWKLRQEIEALEQRAADLASGLQFGEAVRLIQGAVKSYPGENSLALLEAQITEQWEQHKWHEAVQDIAKEVRTFLSDGRLDEASDAVNEAVKRYPGEQELDALADDVRKSVLARERASAVENVIRQSEELLQVFQFLSAREILERALDEFQGETEILRQLESVKAATGQWERQQEVNRITSEAHGLVRDAKFDVALALLAGYPRYSAELLSTQESIEEERKQHHRANAIARQVEELVVLLESGQLDTAVERLNQAVSNFPGEPDWEPLITRINEELAARARDLERCRNVKAVALRCEELAQKEQFEEALGLLGEAISHHGADSTFLVLQRSLNDAQKKHGRAQAISRAVQHARGLIDESRLEEAIRDLQVACSDYPGESVIAAVLAEAEINLALKEDRDRLTREALVLIERNRFEDAIQSSERALTRFPGDPQLISLTALAQEKLSVRRREETIAAVLADALALASEHKFESALLILEKGLQSRPDEKRLIDVQVSVRSAQVEWQRDQVRLETISTLQELARGEHFAQGVERTTAALVSYPDEPELLRLRDEFGLHKTLAEVAALREQREFDDALVLLEQSSTAYGSLGEWKALKTELQAEIAAREQVAAVDKKSQEARALADFGHFVQAGSLIDSAMGKWGSAPALLDAHRYVNAAKLLFERRQALERAVDECRQLANNTRYSEAVEFVTTSLLYFPDDPMLLDLRAEMRTAWDEHERNVQYEGDLQSVRDVAVERIAGFIEASEALENLRRIVEKYPENEEIRLAAAEPMHHLSDIEDTRKQIDASHFSGAIVTCMRYLERHPEHRVFGALRDEAERGQRAVWLEEVLGRADREPDLLTRTTILEEAVSRYPDSQRATAELRFTRNRLQLVNAVISEARSLEAAGEWEAALEEWLKLKSIYDQFPRLSEEIRRVQVAREHAHAEEIAQWTGQIEAHLSAGDIGNARSSLQRALTDLPEAVPLHNLGRRLDDFQQKQKELRKLLRQVRASGVNRNLQELEEDTRRAIELSAGHIALREFVLAQFVEHAGKLAESEWQSAEALLTLVQLHEPSYAWPTELLRLVANGRRVDAVNRVLQRADELVATGDIPGASKHLRDALGEFPDDAQLAAANRRVGQRLEEQQARLTSELSDICASCDLVKRRGELNALESRFSALALDIARHPGLEVLAENTARTIELRRNQLSFARVVTRVVPIRRVLATAAALVVLVAATLVATRVFRSLSQVTVAITSEPPAASVEIAGTHCVTPGCTLRLRPGEYKIAARKDGFKPLARSLKVLPGQSETQLPLTLEPLPEELQVNTNFETGSVYFDTKFAGELRNGQFSMTGLATGRHTLRIQAADTDFLAEWRSGAGSLPELIRPFAVRNVQAAVVANVGERGVIACNCLNNRISVDGTSVPGVNPDGAVALAHLELGSRRVRVGDRSFLVNIRPNPGLNVFLEVKREVGTLVVQSSEDNAKVYVNGLSAGKTDHGILRIPLKAGEYSIRIEKEGFRNSERQSALIVTGQDKEVKFSLAPLPPSLAIMGAPPSAQVTIDGRLVGLTDNTGAFYKDLTPGHHSILLTKEGYSPAQFSDDFLPGSNPLRPPRAQLAMTKLALPPPPELVPKPDTEQKEWANVAETNRIQDVQEFIRKHPGSSHDREARSLLDHLQTAEAAREERASWDRVDKRDKSALQDFLKQHATGPYAREVQALIESIIKNEAADAQAAVREAEQERARQERAARAAADTQAIGRVLKEFVSANDRKDVATLERLYPSIGTTYLNQFRILKSVEIQLVPQTAVDLSGDTARVVCNRVFSVTSKEGIPLPKQRNPVRVTLVRVPSGWIIRAMDPI